MVSVIVGMIYCLVALYLWWEAYLDGVDLQQGVCVFVPVQPPAVHVAAVCPVRVWSGLVCSY